jgi:hypothetical protein
MNIILKSFKSINKSIIKRMNHYLYENSEIFFNDLFVNDTEIY